MAKTISDVIDIEGISPENLFKLLTDSKKISEITGFETKISTKEGDELSALNGGVFGRNLFIKPGRMIVQSWRRITWKKDWLDAILILSLTEKENGTRIDMTNANLPETELQFIDWNTYWNPVREYMMKKAQKAGV